MATHIEIGTMAHPAHYSSKQLNHQALSHKERIAAYKDQQQVVRFFKDPMFMASTLFLKSPQAHYGAYE